MYAQQSNESRAGVKTREREIDQASSKSSIAESRSDGGLMHVR